MVFFFNLKNIHSILKKRTRFGPTKASELLSLFSIVSKMLYVYFILFYSILFYFFNICFWINLNILKAAAVTKLFLIFSKFLLSIFIILFLNKPNFCTTKFWRKNWQNKQVFYSSQLFFVVVVCFISFLVLSKS